jgi:Aminoglycoside-2''-adenylyltransferase
MVTDIGDDARWNVSAAEVGTVLGIPHRAGFDRVWIAGGWGVDALVGHQTRIHSDLDLAVDVTQMALDHLLQAFGRHGYGVEADWRPSRVALVAGGARQVDVHPNAQGTVFGFAQDLVGATLRACQPRIMKAEPTMICPIDSEKVPSVGGRNMVTGIETINNPAAHRG